ncbi:MAG: hypothetical protein ACE5H7_05440 [Acidiferrobacterales bacterium]
MTALAKLSRRVNSDRFAGRIGARMAIDAPNQAVLFAPDPLMHDPVAVEEQKFHMVLAHKGRRLDASLGIAYTLACLRPDRLWHTVACTVRRSKRSHRGQHEQSGVYDPHRRALPDQAYSPMPMSM